nr:hypothetical protein OG999_01080 [Streptomyces sp. NBC_00886]
MKDDSSFVSLGPGGFEVLFRWTGAFGFIADAHAIPTNGAWLAVRDSAEQAAKLRHRNRASRIDHADIGQRRLAQQRRGDVSGFSGPLGAYVGEEGCCTADD